jgi:hypothetical protein
MVYRWLDSKPERIMLGRYPDLSIEQARDKTIEINRYSNVRGFGLLT